MDIEKNNILFITGCFPKETQSYYLSNSINYNSIASDVLSWRIIEGFDYNYTNNFTVFSCPFVSTYPKNFKKPILKSYNWSHNNLIEKKDKVIGFLNFRVISIFHKSRKLKKEIIKWVSESKSNRHVLFYSNDVAFMRIVKSLKTKYPELIITVLITDLNEFDNDLEKPKNFKEFLSRVKYNYRINCVYGNMKYADKFVLLAEKMKDFIHIGNRPYLICEGISNSNVPYISMTEKANTMKVVYSGTLHKRYGVGLLAEAISELDPSIELYICGDGDLRQKIISLSKERSNIHYLGVLPNNEVIKLQQSADLLVNSMPNFGRHTELSFPSKLMEYMVQGRPVLCFKVDGIPKEYDSFLLYFSDYSKKSIKNAILNVYNMPFEEKVEIGKRNRKFILEKKNQQYQTKRILHFILEEED